MIGTSFMSVERRGEKIAIPRCRFIWALQCDCARPNRVHFVKPATLDDPKLSEASVVQPD
jgi:hypothetical protein